MFENVLGQHAAKHYLTSLIAAQRLPHGLLFQGPPRVGKFSMAHAFAKALNCRNAKHGKCLCSSCRKIDEEMHPDVKHIGPNDKGRITIDQIRELDSAFQFRRHEGVRKVAVIKDAHKLNQQSSNALLKTLEEPSEDTTIVLTTSKPQALFDTIRSRCQHIRFSFLSDDDLDILIEQNNVDADEVGLTMMAGSYAPERLRSSLILLKHIWDGAYVDLPDKIEVGQLSAELVYLGTVFSYLLRTGKYEHREVIVARANSERLANLFAVTEQALMYCHRGVRPFLIVQWVTNRMREILV